MRRYFILGAREDEAAVSRNELAVVRLNSFFFFFTLTQLFVKHSTMDRYCRDILSWFELCVLFCISFSFVFCLFVCFSS